jgi:hypothetical protein
MKVSRIALLAATGWLTATPVYAACSPGLAVAVSGVTIDTPGCDVIWTNTPTIPLTTPTVNPGDPAPTPGSHGIEVIVKDTATNKVGSDGGKIVDVINANAHTMIHNDTVLDNKKVDKTRLDIFGPSPAAPAGSLEHWAGGVNHTLGTHNDQIVALQNLTASHTASINAHSALLSDHSARLNEHEKGLAIAMAMPDAWLSDKERFAIAGNLGGFGDETAVGFAAIIRVDEHWSLNSKLGSDTQFEQFGWTVGARAGF